MQTDHKLRENPNDGFVQTFECGEMDSNFSLENALLFGMASFAGHGEHNFLGSTVSVILDSDSMLRLAAVVRCSRLNTMDAMSYGVVALGWRAMMGCRRLA
jgi:hypothetical protein